MCNCVKSFYVIHQLIKFLMEFKLLFPALCLGSFLDDFLSLSDYCRKINAAVRHF